MRDEANAVLSKVPAITLGFWIIKVLATTLGETGGDTLSMTYDLGYLASSAIFIVPLIVLVAAFTNAPPLSVAAPDDRPVPLEPPELTCKMPPLINEPPV